VNYVMHLRDVLKYFTQVNSACTKYQWKGSKRFDISLNSTMFLLYNDVIFVKKDKTAIK